MEAKLYHDDESVSFYEDGRGEELLETVESQIPDPPPPPSRPDGSPAVLLQEIDGFITTSSFSNSSEILNFVDLFLETVESKISSYEQREDSFKLGQNEDEDAFFYESITRIWKLMNKMEESNRSAGDAITKLVCSRASLVLQRAMCFLDDEFRSILDSNSRKMSNLGGKSPQIFKQASLSFNINSDSDPSSALPEPGQEFAAYSVGAICSMNRISNSMIFAGYEAECCLLYGTLRRNAFKAELINLGFENITIDELQRMPWESLETEIGLWISAVRLCSTNLFPVERDLCASVFPEHVQIARRLFHENASAVVLRLLKFVDGVVLIKRSSEKLFKLVDVYETLSDLIQSMDGETWQDLMTETSEAQSRIGEVVVSIFNELANSIKSDVGRIPVPSGAVHPLTRYIMNYLKYTCEYKGTLEKIFEQNQNADMSSRKRDDPDPNQKTNIEKDDDSRAEETAFSVRLTRIMDLLDENLEKKSKLYRDPALRSVFLMNNGRYIVKKVEGSSEIHEMMGSTWARKKTLQLHKHHKNYQRETWGRVLQSMRHDGVQQGNGKVSKTAVKERFKNFNASFEEIHKTQSTWVVSDEQMQSELRVSISAVVVPAYRSFLGKFKQYLGPSGRQSEKYIKYQPEDIESLIEGLFDGNLSTMSRRRT